VDAQGRKLLDRDGFRELLPECNASADPNSGWFVARIAGSRENVIQLDIIADRDHIAHGSGRAKRGSATGR
jgi:hypothetical protein